MAKTKSKNPNVDAESLHQWCYSLVTDGRKRRLPHEAQWWENIATYLGDLWVEFDIHNNKLIEAAKPHHRVRLPINLAQPAVRTEYAKLLKNRPLGNCIARSTDHSDINAAEVGDKLANDYGENKFHKPRVRRTMLQWVLLCGSGAIFVDYDETALGNYEVVVGPDGEPLFDPEAIRLAQEQYKEKKKAPKKDVVPQGELRIVPLSPWQFISDFSKINIDEAAWVIVSEVFDVDEVYRRWNVDVEPENVEPGVMEKRLLARLDLSGQMKINKITSQNMCEIHRMFIKPGHRYFSNGAEIIFTSKETIDATVFPHTHGELPVSTMGHVFFPVSQHPLSVVQQVRPITLEISKTESQMIENRNLMANPPWVEFRQNRVQGEIQNKPGARIKLDYVPGVPEPHPVEMPDLPQYVKDLPNILGQHILEVTGQNETSQGQVPAGARSGVAIAYLSEENDTKLGPTVQEFEECIERSTWQELQLYGQHYDAPRTIQIYKKGSAPEVFDFQGAMLEGVAGFHVQAGSALPRSLAAKQQFTLDLYDRGLIRNPRQVMEMLDVGAGEVDEWEKDMDQAERENAKMRLGEEAQVKDWYNHQAHLYVHHSFMKSPDYEELDQPTQAIFEAHEQEHQQEIALQQQNAMRAQMQQSPQGNGPGQVANGQNQRGPQGPYSSPDDIGAAASSSNGNVQDYQPQ